MMESYLALVAAARSLVFASPDLDRREAERERDVGDRGEWGVAVRVSVRWLIRWERGGPAGRRCGPAWWPSGQLGRLAQWRGPFLFLFISCFLFYLKTEIENDYLG